MKLTPIDVQQQQFKGKLFGGLNPEEVDSFLQVVAREMEDLVRENAEIRDQLKAANASKEELVQREKELRETLVAAHRIIEEMKASAQKEANLIIAEAELKAEKILADAEARLAQTRNEISELQREKLRFESSLKSLLDSYYKMLSTNESS